MIFAETGEAHPGFFVLGQPGVPSYLLDATKPALIDAGFACLGGFYERHARQVLGGRRPERLLLTHVHYDHVGAAGRLRRAFPGLRVAASRRGAEILANPRAVALMTALNKEAAKAISRDWQLEGLSDEAFEGLEVDELLADGDEVDLGDKRLRVLATPGHTRDFLSYYEPDEGILVASEAAGCAHHSGYIMTEFLVDYDDYIASLRRLAALEVEVLCQGHIFVYTGEEARSFFGRSLAQAEEFRERVEGWLRAEGGDVDRVVGLVRRWEYDPLDPPKQPEQAYMLNTTARVRALAQRLGLERAS